MTALPGVLPIREIYCPSHFGNSYEAALPNEIAAILSEANFWGFNRFSDWFDTIDLYDVYRGRSGYNLPEAMWDRKFQNFTAAGRLGLELALVITPNHVFADQVTPANEARKDGRIFGQLVCPSKPGVGEMILENYRNLFADFQRRDLPLCALQAFAYDYGGCACENCRPWIVTFGKLYRQIVELACGMFGRIEAGLAGWWWTEEDHRLFTDWADREAPGVFHSLSFFLPEDTTSYAAWPIPKGARERAFIHTSYGETSTRDMYGHCGPCIAPKRLEQTARDLTARGAEGYCTYSEGLFDEINQALVAGLTSGQFRSADDVLTAYAQRHFGGDPTGWCDWLRAIGDYDTIDLPRARRAFDALKPCAKPGWRLQQLEERLIMAGTDAAVRSRLTWDAERLRAADEFWAAKERLYRQVWRLGLTRHILQFDGGAPPWHADYLKAKGAGRALAPPSRAT
jgi:hypothetical protein